MPKEIVNDLHHDWMRVEVGWSREQCVQLGTVNPDAAQPHESAYGWFVELDRTGINRLIRTLRKARDQAFGSDA